ncbi:MAG: hypothetical protein IAE89_01090 [Anaerolineae bacterium]|nr:hypothetical protein [Anaerolineae bacterium]
MSTEVTITPEPAEEIHYCAVHLDRETSLRCNKCGRYMCSECAISTPVGYRCKQCVRGVEDQFFNAALADYALVFVISAFIAATAAVIARLIGLPLLFAIILGLPLGGLISEAAVRALRRKRGRYTGGSCVTGIIIGGVIGLGAAILLRLSGASVSEIPLQVIFQAMFSQIGPLLMIGLAAFAAFGRFRIRR